jgi:ABC-type branched-subunit amino acid transport system ATPase component
VLDEVNIKLKYNDFLVVVGAVGAGKTTLLYSIMDETRKHGGTQVVKGKIAYVE